MKAIMALVLVAATCVAAGCAGPQETALKPQRQEALDRYEQCQRDSIGDAEHARDCRDAVPL